MSGHTKEPWAVAHDQEWPFDLLLLSDEKAMVRQTRAAYSTKAETLADIRDAVGFDHNERAAVVIAVAEQEAFFERMASSMNALAGVKNPAALPALIEAAKAILLELSDEPDFSALDRAEHNLRTALANLQGDAA